MCLKFSYFASRFSSKTRACKTEATSSDHTRQYIQRRTVNLVLDRVCSLERSNSRILGETAVGQFVRRHSCPSGTRGAGLIVRPLSHLVTLEFDLSSEQTLSRTKYYSSSFYRRNPVTSIRTCQKRWTSCITPSCITICITMFLTLTSPH